MIDNAVVAFGTKSHTRAVATRAMRRYPALIAPQLALARALDFTCEIIAQIVELPYLAPDIQGGDHSPSKSSRARGPSASACSAMGYYGRPTGSSNGGPGRNSPRPSEHGCKPLNGLCSPPRACGRAFGRLCGAVAPWTGLDYVAPSCSAHARGRGRSGGLSFDDRARGRAAPGRATRRPSTVSHSAESYLASRLGAPGPLTGC
jgi:hypothetical protein